MINTGGGGRTTCDSSGNKALSKQGGAESGALGVPNAPIDAQLNTIIHAWPSLPAELKVCIVSMTEAAMRKGGGE